MAPQSNKTKAKKKHKKGSISKAYPYKISFKSKDEFDSWLKWFKMPTKGPQRGFIRYICYPRSGVKCQHSKTSKNHCGATLRFKESTTGPYFVEHNLLALLHVTDKIFEESNDTSTSASSSRQNEDFSDASTSTSSSIRRNEESSDSFTSTSSNDTSTSTSSNRQDVQINMLSVQDVGMPVFKVQSETISWKDDMDKLACTLSKNVTISSETTSPYDSEKQPPEIICVAKTNGVIDWKTVAANSNLKMVFARISIGKKEDEHFHYNFTNMLEMDLKQVGALHYFIGHKKSPSPKQQFETVINALDKAGFDKKKHLIAIAVQTERNAEVKPKDYTAKLVIFINLLNQAGFMRPIIYCNYNSWFQLIDPNIADRQFSGMPLWIAHWKTNSPNYPGTWRNRGIPYWMWHYTNIGHVKGIITPVYVSKRNELYSIDTADFQSAV